MYILETIFYNCELSVFWISTSFMLTAEAITQTLFQVQRRLVEDRSDNTAD